MTYIQLVNSVLRRLREDEVATISESPYSKLVGDFINETKRELEDSWQWTQLRQNIPVTTVSGTNSYTLTGAGERSRLLQVINDTTNSNMSQVPYTWINTQNDTGSPTNSSPSYYCIQGITSGDVDVTVFPTPAAVETLNFYAVVPQADLTVDADILSVPSWPVVLGAYAKSLSERGEDGGSAFAETARMYNMSLGDAIAIDARNVPTETVWGVG